MTATEEKKLATVEIHWMEKKKNGFFSGRIPNSRKIGKSIRMEENHRQESIGEGVEISEEQRHRAESNRLAAIARRRRAALSGPSITNSHNQWRLSKCRKLNPQDIPSVLKEESSANDEGYEEKFIVRLEICSPDSFSATPVPAPGFVFPGEEAALRRLEDWLADVSFLFSLIWPFDGSFLLKVIKLVK